MTQDTYKGFTLAELLIALAILGVIATFTIPKILTSQQNHKYNAVAKEAVSMISGAYQAYKLEHTPSGTTRNSDLTPYLNYVSVDTTSLIDSDPGDSAGASMDCATATCIKLHNGGILQFTDDLAFGDTKPLDYVPISLDPSGNYEGQNDAIYFDLYFDGRITSLANRYPGSLRGDVLPAVGPCAGCDPPWFSW